MNTPQSVIDRYTSAVMNLDREAMLSLFAEDLKMFDTVTPWKFENRNEWAVYIDEWFSAGATYAKVEASDVHIRTFADCAHVSMNMRYAEHGGGGMTNRITWLLVPDGEEWKILHEHASVPLHRTEMTPQFQP